MTNSELDALIHSLAAPQARSTAIDQLYRGYARRFAAYLMRRGVAAQDVEDLVQDAFLRLVRAAPGFGGGGNAHAWIWRVARSAWLDRWKTKPPVAGALDGLPEAVMGVTPDVAPAADFQDCVEGQLSRFARSFPAGGQALLWAAVDGFSTAQIAELLGRRAGATREFLSQTRKKLREFLAPCLD